MIIIQDRVKEYTSFSGLLNISLEGSEQGFRTFSSVCANNDEVYYCVSHRYENEWEIGKGSFSTLDNTLSRNTLLSSSTGSFVDFTAGGKDVYLTHPAYLLDIITRLNGPVILGKKTTGEGIVEQITIPELKSILNISSSDIQGLISNNPDNIASFSNGVYVPPISINLLQIYQDNKQ